MLSPPRNLNDPCSTSMTCESLPGATRSTGSECNVTEEQHGGKRNVLWSPRRSPVSNHVTCRSARRFQGVLACLLCLFRCCLTAVATDTVIQADRTYRNNAADDFGGFCVNDYAEPRCTAEIAAEYYRAFPCSYTGYEISRNSRSGTPVRYFAQFYTGLWSFSPTFGNEAGTYDRDVICWHLQNWRNDRESVANLGGLRTYLVTGPDTRLPPYLRCEIGRNDRRGKSVCYFN